MRRYFNLLTVTSHPTQLENENINQLRCFAHTSSNAEKAAVKAVPAFAALLTAAEKAGGIFSRSSLRRAKLLAAQDG